MKSYNPQETDWSPAYYADLAVKAGLRLGNTAEAKASCCAACNWNRTRMS